MISLLPFFVVQLLTCNCPWFWLLEHEVVREYNCTGQLVCQLCQQHTIDHENEPLICGGGLLSGGGEMFPLPWVIEGLYAWEDCVNKSKALLSAVILRVEWVFKSNLHVEPPKHFLEECELFEWVEVVAPKLLQTSKARNGKLVTHPDNHFLLASLLLLVRWIEIELTPLFFEYMMVSFVRCFLNVYCIEHVLAGYMFWTNR